MAYKIPNIEYLKTGEKARLDILLLKAEYRKNGIVSYMKSFLEEYPEYNTGAGVDRVRAVWNGDTADNEVYLKLKSLLNKLKNGTKS